MNIHMVMPIAAEGEASSGGAPIFVQMWNIQCCILYWLRDTLEIFFSFVERPTLPCILV